MDGQTDLNKAVSDLALKVAELNGRVSALPGVWQILGPVFGIVALSTATLGGALWATSNRLDGRMDRLESRLDAIYARLDDRLRTIERQQAALDAILQLIAQRIGAAPAPTPPRTEPPPAPKQ